MGISRDDAVMALQRVTAQALLNTDLVIAAVPTATDKLELRSSGSAVLLEARKGFLAVTCDHVVSKGTVHYSGPGRLDRPKAPDKPNEHTVGPAELVATNVAADLALLRTDASAYLPGKVPYDLSKSDFVTEQLLQKQVGTAAFILGYWGEMSRAFAYPDGLFYLEAPLYAAIGPLSESSSEELIADMAEKDVLFRNDKVFPQIAQHVPTGGKRDLSGISGSGLWMMDKTGPVLVGIVLGSRPGSSEQHLIRAAPVWVLREWMSSLSLV